MRGFVNPLPARSASFRGLFADDVYRDVRAYFAAHPDAIEVEPVQPNTIGMHRVCLTVDDIDAALEIAARHGCHPLRGVATYEDVYKLTYLRGPSGILVMFAQELKKQD